ncbi:hypothetical protein G7Y89_g10019 [Cudoniella acicularis]|uniref:EGF-like domain-containing protein n=1 Tax=Cudoniella acicularis TaxID=354080 RepID=A0A8H4REK9_9HELO|nr:hypothetical protein G7Y89_g10019 [Cudoniella acicularis]
MSQQWAPQSRSPGGGGSVRRARERMEAGLPPEVPQLPPQKTYDPSRPAPNPPANRSRPQMPLGLATTKNGPIGVAISRPTQVPQWPLSGTIEGPDPRTNQQYQPPPGRGAPPQRPPRPSHVPSMLDASRLQEHTPAFQYKPQQIIPEGRSMASLDDEVNSPGVASPMTQSSRPSTVSSVGTIPDFPVPVVGPPRRSVHLGPPPSSRRGASSYYSQASYVSPIPEESPRTQPSQHGSYASSAAIPSSWGSEYDDDEEIQDSGYSHDTIEEGRESRGSTVDDSDDRGLIRSASFGKRAKPSLVTTRSSDRTEQFRPSPRPVQGSKLEKMGVFDGSAGGPARDMSESRKETMWPMSEGGAGPRAAESPESSREQRGIVWPMIGNVDSLLAGGTGLIDASTSSSENTVPTLARAITTDDAVSPLTRLADSSDARAQEMLGAYNAASSLQPTGPTPSRTPSPSGFSRLSAIRRPPRLDMDAVRDAEARGSLTSLPDLIRRATRLAAMMDRGKRPGSRLNDLNDFPMDGVGEKEFSPIGGEKHQSGLSGMLAAFPPPGVATPREDTPRPPSTWPSRGYDETQDTLDQNSKGGKKKRRRCCGLPCWGFFIIIVILLIIIAAAVVVPLELLVFRKPKTTSTTSLSALQQCAANSSTACQNGGTSLIDEGSCACVCINGFTGSTCTTSGATGCTTTTLAGSSLVNVTLGEAIPRLISAAQTNFSIPLSETVILARFNSANLSCTVENALVTFDGESERQGNANDAVTPSSMASPAASSITSAPNRRGISLPDSTIIPISSSAASAASAAASSTISIMIDSSSAPTRTSTATSSPSSAPSASPSAAFAITEEVLDFARVAVLYVLQQEQMASAVTAQSALQKFFNPSSFTNAAAMNVSLGNGNTINLVGFTINVGNGTVGQSSTKKRRSIQRMSSNVWDTR